VACICNVGVMSFYVIAMLQHTATHCNTLQHTNDTGLSKVGRGDAADTTTHCNTLQHTATHCNTLTIPGLVRSEGAMRRNDPWSNTLKHLLVFTSITTSRCNLQVCTGKWECVHMSQKVCIQIRMILTHLFVCASVTLRGRNLQVCTGKWECVRMSSKVCIRIRMCGWKLEYTRMSYNFYNFSTQVRTYGNKPEIVTFWNVFNNFGIQVRMSCNF